jgi:hypothetical protein
MKRKTRRGFALIVAIALVAMVAMTIASIGFVMRTEVLRTRAAGDEAQLRQLLLAGTQTARARLAAAGGKADGAMALPDSLAGAGASVSLTEESTAADQAAVRIEASLGSRRLSQVVHFVQKSGAWQVDAAELGA